MRETAELENPVWNSLASSHVHLAVVEGDAARYRPDVSPLAGLREPTDQAFADLRKLTTPGEVLGLVTARAALVPDEWRVLKAIVIDQMVCVRQPEVIETPHVGLQESDVPEMMSLVKATEPGPFAAGTIRMGHYWGMRSPEGRLMSMVGQRMQMPGLTEISAVCTWPEFQGRGLSKALMTQMIALIFKEGCTPFLHVKTTNAAAKGLYEKLGFVVSRPIHFTVFELR